MKFFVKHLKKATFEHNASPSKPDSQVTDFWSQFYLLVPRTFSLLRQMKATVLATKRSARRGVERIDREGETSKVEHYFQSKLNINVAFKSQIFVISVKMI